MTTPAPIALFTFKKLEPLKRTISALKCNQLSKKSDLIIFSDAARNSRDFVAVKKVRDFLKTISGFKTVSIKEASENQGLATSIIQGVSLILSEYDSVIVMEDDLLCSTNFLDYMNTALSYYSSYSNVFSISGYTPPIDNKEYEYDIYFTLRASSWGWGTWKKQWEAVDWNVTNYENFTKDRKAQRRFNEMGSDMTNMLTKQQQGNLDSWAIRWCFHQFQHKLYTVFPLKSKIQNIGFIDEATHTNYKGSEKRFATPLDIGNKSDFLFSPVVAVDAKLIKQFVIPYSLRTRIYYRLKSFFRL